MLGRGRMAHPALALSLSSLLLSVGCEGCIYTREFDFVVRDPAGVSVSEVGSGTHHNLLYPNTTEILSDGSVVQRGTAGGIAVDVEGTALLDSMMGRSFHEVLVRPDGTANADGPLGDVEIDDGSVRVPACYGTGKHPCARRLFLDTPTCNVKVLREREVPLRALGAGWLLLGGGGATAFAFQMDTGPKYLAVDTAVLGLFATFVAIGVANLVAPSKPWVTAEPSNADCAARRESP
jgi:hypothetical protein